MVETGFPRLQPSFSFRSRSGEEYTATPYAYEQGSASVSVTAPAVWRSWLV